MTATKVPVDIRTAWLSKVEQVELENLYARRSAIDALIESLVDYDRFREKKGSRTQTQDRLASRYFLVRASIPSVSSRSVSAPGWYRRTTPWLSTSTTVGVVLAP